MYFPYSMKKLIRVILAISFAALTSGWNSSPIVHTQEQRQVDPDQFDLLTTTSGWVLLGDHLFWTSDAGASWKEISPSLPPEAEVQDVQFTDPQTGWALGMKMDPNAGASFHLAHTEDGGQTWMSGAISLFEPGEIASHAERAEMAWFDAQTGWISVKQTTGSNFSLGTLFTTSNGGESWTRFALPVAGNVYFSDPQTGWAVGGPTESEIFQTRDGGATWSDVRPSDLPNDLHAVVYPPVAADEQGLLAVTTLETEHNLTIYALENTGQWSPLHQLKLDALSERIALSILDVQNFVAVIPGTSSLVRMTDGVIDVIDNKDGRSDSIVELDMASTNVGWARSMDSHCVDDACTSSTHLLQTTNGGLTWQRVDLPIVKSTLISSGPPDTTPAPSASEKFATGNTEVLIGQGFDKCEIPSLSQMQTWWDASPYEAVNLYIGGSSRACANSALTPSYLSRLYKQGWKFIPTWVGPQAPCTGYRSRMSSDVTVAFGQGAAEADLAVERLAALGLTDPDKTGSVVYYDIEHYGTETACRAAVNAFMNGWVSQLRARGNLAGVYGSTVCNTGISDFQYITYVPDVIWPARWYHNLGAGYYDPTADVWNLGSCIPNTAWSSHQRIRQYEGDHNEVWGGLALAVDSNVLDGVVALPDTTPVEVSIAAQAQGPYKLVPGQVTQRRFATVNNGPVKITSPDNIPLIASQRVIYKVSGVDTSFTEMMGLPDSQLDSTYWLPWYNNVDLDTQLRFANVSSSTATVHIYIAGTEMTGSPFTLGAGESTRKSFPAINNGPVRIVSNQNIVAAERVIYTVAGKATSFTEMMALPDSQLDTIYWLPWYNNVDLDTQLRFANATNSTATVRVYIGGQEMQGSPFTLGPRASTRVSFAGINNGPVKIVSDVKIVAAERVIYKVRNVATSFVEMMGLPDSQLHTTYWLPWYDNLNVDTQLRFGNVSSSTATVHVYIDGIEMNGSPFTLGVGESTRQSFVNVNRGPVQIVSNVPIVAAERLIYRVNGLATSFSEMMGLPASQLDTTYWLPWYNNVDLDTQLRFGIP